MELARRLSKDMLKLEIEVDSFMESVVHQASSLYRLDLKVSLVSLEVFPYLFLHGNLESEWKDYHH